MKLLPIACLLALGVAATSCRKPGDIEDRAAVTPVARGAMRGRVLRIDSADETNLEMSYSGKAAPIS